MDTSNSTCERVRTRLQRVGGAIRCHKMRLPPPRPHITGRLGPPSWTWGPPYIPHRFLRPLTTVVPSAYVNACQCLRLQSKCRICRIINVSWRKPRRKADLLTATSLLSLVPRLSLHTTTMNSNFCCRRRAGGEPGNEANLCLCQRWKLSSWLH